MGGGALPPLGDWVLLTARLLPAVLTLPPLAGAHLPRPAQLALAAALAAALLPAAPSGEAATAAPFLALLLKELAVGAVLATAGVVAVEALRVGGRLADELRGAGQAAGEDTPLARLHGLLACLMFFALGGPEAGLAAIRASLARLPLSAFPDGACLQAAAALSVSAFGAAFELAVAVAFPAALSGLAVDLLLGWVGRSAPGLPVHFAVLPLRAALALGAVWLTLQPALGAWIRQAAWLLAGPPGG